MRNIYKINRSNLWSRILVLWLLFSISVLVLSSCSNSRSVRNNNFLAGQKNKTEKKAKTKAKAEKPVEEEESIAIPEIEKFAQNAQKQKNKPTDEEVLSSYNSNNARIPTLREQMKSISDDQQTMNSKINNLQNDVADIKHTLNEIKNALDDIETKPKSVYRGPDNKTNPDVNSKENENLDETFIVSAEEESDWDDETYFEEPVEQKPKVKKEAKKEVKKPITKKVTPKQTEKTPIAPKKEIEPKVEKPVSINEDFELAMKLFAEKSFSQAIEKFKSASGKTKDSGVKSDCNYYLGECYFAMKDYNTALNYFNKSVNSGKSNKKDNAQLMIAEAHVRAGKVDEAKSAYQNLIKNYPDSELIAKAKKMLQQL